MKKKKTKLFTKRQVTLIVLFFVLAMAGYVYFLFFKPIAPDYNYTPVSVASAAENPNNSEVEDVLKSGKAVRIHLPGCPNLCKVSDTLYRGAQPTREGFENLKKLGIKTIVSLRDHHSDEELLTGTGLEYIPLSTDTWEVSPDTIAAFLKVAVDPDAAPVFVHCLHGADRTGTMVASYRIVIQGWEKKRAIREMTHGGYGYHPLWVELPNILRALDVEAMKTQIGHVQQ